MNVNIEFFSDEPLENIATCLSYNVDKIIFIGYKEAIKAANQRYFTLLLKNVLNIKYVAFVPVEHYDLSDIMDKLEETVLVEQRQGNTCYFDLTGGDDLILVAAGIIAARHCITMHQIEIDTGTLHEYAISNKLNSISSIKKETHILSMTNYMKFRGTCVNYRMHKDYKSHLEDKEFVQDIKNLWKISKRFRKKWNIYGKYFRSTTDIPIDAVATSNYVQGDNIADVYEFLERLEKIGILQKLRMDKHCFHFKYKNKNIKDCLCDSGSILELYTYITAIECNFFDSCDIGVHLDWDGTIDGWLPDVTNEVDVLLMKDNIPAFISCKNGNLDKTALYELDTIAKKFGGKYAKKIIISTQLNDEAIDERAAEMGIILISKEIFDWSQDEFKEYLMDIYRDSK